ncbi:MAG: hypothetical protein HEQ34_01600 [Sphingorhabdus sp.]|uniref:hypothetical protein n=1 Tax=Sphingorhabdus sp. TaxID=1902408 RepID=UPI0025E97430|nr:hypothetical protein [Sphingorhabdus sp.]MCO4090634.1 hypothetical protein [Sphingorhabdus sp.]
MTYIPNSWISFDAGTDTQLTYAVYTDPMPLTVSLPNENATMGRMQIVITNSTSATVDLASVSLSILVGSGAALMQSTGNVETQVSDTTNWSFTNTSGTIKSGTALFVLAPETGDSVALAAGASITLEIYDFPTVTTPASSTVQIKEMVSGSAPRFGSFTITTFPYGFFFDSLTATVQQGSAFNAVSQVPHGTTVALVWNSSVVDTTAVTIYYSDPSQGQQQVTPAEIGKWSGVPLTADTVFTVVVTAAFCGGRPITASLSTAVSVQNPDLVASSLAVSGVATVGGTLTVTEASALQSATLSGALSVAGNTNLSTAAVSGNLNVTGSSTLGTAKVNGALYANGGAIITGTTLNGGPVAALASAQAIGAGTHQANTDGFVVGYVGSPGFAGQWGLAVASTIITNSSGAVARATGGNAGAFYSNWQQTTFTNAQSAMLPIRNGESYSVSISQLPANECNPDCSFWFIPLGAGSPGAATIQLSDEITVNPEAHQVVASTPVERNTHAADDVVEIMGEIMGKSIPVAEKEKLVAALNAMVGMNFGHNLKPET